MESKKEIKIGDLVTLHFESPSAIGYNGIICRVKMQDKKLGYFCESVYGDARCWAKESELRLIA